MNKLLFPLLVILMPTALVIGLFGGLMFSTTDRCYIATWNEEIMVVRWDGAPVLDSYEAVALLEKTAPDAWQEWFPVDFQYRDDKGAVFYRFYPFDGGEWRVPMGFCRGWLGGEEVLRREFEEIYVRDFGEKVKVWLPLVFGH